MKKKNFRFGLSSLVTLIALAIIALAAGGVVALSALPAVRQVWQKEVSPMPQTTPYRTPITASPTMAIIGPIVGEPVSPGVFEGDLRDLPTIRPFPTEYYRPISAVACQTVKDCYDPDGVTPKGVCSAPCVLACVDGRCKNINPPGGICLAKDTLIDTPTGPVPIQNLKMGMKVWTLDTKGEKKAVSILQTVKTQVPDNHEVVRLLLTDGRKLFASPKHPTADGRTLSQLSPGDILDGSRLVKAELVPYQQDYTYDISPEGETGLYWANGILLKSTLAE